MVVKNGVKLFVLTLFILIILTNFISAETKFIFKQNQELNLSVPVFQSDNSQATSSVTCGISVRDPNGILIISDQPMLYAGGGSFSYIIPASNVSLLGQYPTTTRCNNGVDYGFSTFSFTITPSGTIMSIGEGLLYITILIASVFVLIFFVYGSFKVQFKNKINVMGETYAVNWTKYWKISCFFFAYATLMWIFFITNIIGSKFLMIDIISLLAINIFYFMAWSLVPIIGIGFFIVLLLVLTDFKTHKELIRGLQPRG